MKILFFLTLINWGLRLHTESAIYQQPVTPFVTGFRDSLPERAALFASLRTFHAETDSANVSALNVPQSAALIRKKFEWMHWMPSVGFTLGKPTVSFSLGQVAANIEAKALRKADALEREAQKAAEIRKILRGGILAFRADSFALVALLERHETLSDALPFLREVEAIENRRFEILKGKYAAKEITPLEFENAKLANLRSGEPLQAKREEIVLLEIEIRKTAKY